jgi:hypothetical protein
MRAISENAKFLTGLQLHSTNAVGIEGVKFISDNCTKLRAVTLSFADNITNEVFIFFNFSYQCRLWNIYFPTVRNWSLSLSST